MAQDLIHIFLPKLETLLAIGLKRALPVDNSSYFLLPNSIYSYCKYLNVTLSVHLIIHSQSQE